MKFLKHIFKGWMSLVTIAFNLIFIFYIYELFFHLDSFYDGTPVIGTLLVLVIYTAYWSYNIETFKDDK